MSLASVTLQNMFPSIDVWSVRLHECRRVMCCSYDKESGSIQLRYYATSSSARWLALCLQALLTGNAPDHAAVVRK